MKFKPDWLYLRPALLVMAMALAFAVVLKLVGHGYLSEMTLLYQQKSAEYGETEAALNILREDEQIIADYSNAFTDLERAGLFDTKQRVDWVDAVNGARTEMKLPLVRYQISPQSAFMPEYLQTDEYVSVVTSNVKFEAGLLHEGDLVDLFAWMERYVPGQLHLSQCDMTRTEQYFAYYADRPNLNVVCDLNWLTMQPQQQEVMLDG